MRPIINLVRIPPTFQMSGLSVSNPTTNSYKLTIHRQVGNTLTLHTSQNIASTNVLSNITLATGKYVLEITENNTIVIGGGNTIGVPQP